MRARQELMALAAAALLAASVVGCGGSRSDTPLAPEPEAGPSLEVLQTKTATIGRSGGTIPMDRDVRIVFPPGTLDREIQIEVKLLSAAPYLDEDSDGIALAFASPLEAFGSRSHLDDLVEHIEISVPLPTWYTPDHANAVSASVLDETTGQFVPELASIETLSGEPQLLVRTNQLSTHLLKWSTSAAAASGVSSTGFWGLKSIESDYWVGKEAPDSCYRNHNVAVGALSVRTSSICAENVSCEFWAQSHHSWSAAPPPRLTPGQRWKVTQTVKHEGNGGACGVWGAPRTDVGITLEPGGTYSGYEGRGAQTQAAPPTSDTAEIEWTIPGGGDGTLMRLALTFSGPGGGGGITYTYEWDYVGPIPEGLPELADEPGEECFPDDFAPGSIEVLPVEDDQGAPGGKADDVLGAFALSCNRVVTDDSARAVITLSNGSTLLVGPRSEVIALAAATAGGPRLRAPAGAFWIRADGGAAAGTTGLESDLAAVVAAGATMTVETSSDETVLKVIGGKVAITSLVTGEQATVSTGEAITATADGLSEKSAFSPDAESQAWGIEMFYAVYTAGSVQNNATAPTVFTIDEPWLVTRITTYHWNAEGSTAQGKEPGTIGLEAEDGTLYGPWEATAVRIGPRKVPVYWAIEPYVILPPGTYTVLDSDPSTWSNNQETGYAGQSRGYGIRVPGEADAAP